MSNDTNTTAVEDIKGETPAQKRAHLLLLMRDGAYLNSVDFGTNEAVIAALIRLNEAAAMVRKAYGRSA